MIDPSDPTYPARVARVNRLLGEFREQVRTADNRHLTPAQRDWPGLDIPLAVDPSVPPGTIELRREGRLVGRITGIGS